MPSRIVPQTADPGDFAVSYCHIWWAVTFGKYLGNAANLVI